MCRLLVLSFFILASFGSNAQTMLYVDSAVTVSGAGTSWTAAYKTLNEALNFVNAASTTVQYRVSIARGTYYPTGLQSGTNRDSAFLFARGGIKLYGGYPNGGGTRNIVANPTTLSGNIGSSSTNADNSYHVMVASNIPAAADSIIIDGFSVTGGHANGAGLGTYNLLGFNRGNGAALAQQAVLNSMVITSCSFTIHKSTGSGGAISASGAVLTINASTFTADTSGLDGGAVYAFNTSIHIEASSFTSNYATGNGGAMICGNSKPVVNQCNFVANRSAITGGALCLIRNSVSGPATTVTFCTFTGNTATNFGGAIRDQTDNSTSTVYPSSMLQFNTFTGNTAENGGAIHGINTTGLGNPAYIKGSTFTGNFATLPGGGGGAIYATSANSTFIIDSNIITANRAAGSGGGLYMTGLMTVNRTSFTNDSAGSGGAIYRSSGTVSNCRIISNVATNGGAIYSTGSTVTPNVIANDSISGNRSFANGGALFNYNTSPSITSVLISGNVAGNRGGAIYDSASSSPTIANCTFAGDTAGNTNGIYNTNTSSPTILNSIIWEGAGNSINNFINSIPVVTYSTIAGGYAGTGNLSSDPLFIAPLPASIIPSTGGNYTLAACGPAVNSGLNSGTYIGLTDLAGNARLFGTTVDRGAYEQQTFPVSDAVTLSGVQLTAAQPGATYQWINCGDNSNIPGATGQSYTATHDGQYAVRVMVGNCSITSPCTAINSLGTATIAQSLDVRIYPNPATGLVFVNTGKNVALSITVRDATGRQLFVLHPAGGTAQIDMSAYASGIYQVEVRTGVEKKYTGTISVVK